jgi:hypothetical protein
MTWTLLIALPLAALAALFATPPLRRSVVTRPLFAAYRRMLPQMSQTEKRGARGRQRLVGGRAVPRPPRLEQAAGLSAAEADAGGAILSRQRDRGAVPPLRRLDLLALLDHDLSPQAWQYLKEKGFLGMIIPKRYGGLEFSAFAHSEVVTKLSTRCACHGGVGDGAELPGPGRTAAALRHRGAEEPLPAAPGQGPRHSLLRPDQPLGRLGRRLDPRPGHRLPRHVAREGSRRHARHLGQALHHPGAGRHGGRPRLPPVRPRAPARRGGRHRHHLCPGAGQPSRRRDRPPPLPAQRRLAQRPDARQGRLHAARFHHRRTEDGRPGLAHADGMPRRRPLDLAAGSNTGMQKLAVRTVGGYARVRNQFKTAIGRFEGIQEPLARMGGNLYLSRRRPRHDRRRHRPRREALGGLRHRQVPRHRALPPVDERRHGHPRRQGHLPRPLELPRPRLPAGAGRHHRGRRQHPDAQPDHLRPGRHPLPPLRAGRDAVPRRRTTWRPSTRRSSRISGIPSATACAPSSPASPARISSACRPTSRRRRAATTSS